MDGPLVLRSLTILCYALMLYSIYITALQYSEVPNYTKKPIHMHYIGLVPSGVKSYDWAKLSTSAVVVYRPTCSPPLRHEWTTGIAVHSIFGNECVTACSVISHTHERTQCSRALAPTDANYKNVATCLPIDQFSSVYTVDLYNKWCCIAENSVDNFLASDVF